MQKTLFLYLLLLVANTGIAQQELVLSYTETFHGGASDKWIRNKQFSYEHEYGSTYGLIKVQQAANEKTYNYPFPKFNNANNNLGKDFLVSAKLGNFQPKILTDTAVFFGLKIMLSQEYEINFMVNGINKFQIIAGSDNCIPIIYEAKYEGNKKWGAYAFSDVEIRKKEDSLFFTLNKKPVLKTKIFSLEDNVKPTDMCFVKAEFQALNITGEKISNTLSYLIDDVTIQWKARKGDEVFAEELLNIELDKYTEISKPFFNKYIFARNGYTKCLLNRYGNYIILPTTDDLKITSQSGIFIHEDGGREDFYNSNGEYEEFNAAKTKMLLKSAQYPEYFKNDLKVDVLYLKDASTARGFVRAGSVIEYMKPLGLYQENGLLGVKSKSGVVYIYAYFDSIYVEKQYYDYESFKQVDNKYNYVLKKDAKTWRISANQTGNQQLSTDESETTNCKTCRGFGRIESASYPNSEYIPATYKTIEGRNSYMGTSGYLIVSKWKMSVVDKPARTELGKKILSQSNCTKCNGRGYSQKKTKTLIWNDGLKRYTESWNTE